MPAAERRLAAIMFTDIVGYTTLMAESEEKGLRARERHRELVRPLVEQYHGESIEARGDESLSTFPTALDAVNCALAIDDELRGEAMDADVRGAKALGMTTVWKLNGRHEVSPAAEADYTVHDLWEIFDLDILPGAAAAAAADRESLMPHEDCNADRY